MVRCDIDTAYYDDWTVNCKEKQNKAPPNVTKVWSEVMWVLPNVIMEQSNLRIKKISTTECDKNRVRCNVGTT